MQINIDCNVECQLKCKFCLLGNMPVPTHQLEYDQYIYIFNKCLDFGIDEFTLTPNTGDSLFIKDFFKICNWLESNTRVKTFSFSTNLLALTTKTLDLISSWRKCSMEISIYGFNKSQYISLTGVNLWDKFNIKMEWIFNNMHKFNNFYCLDFLMRGKIDYDSELYKMCVRTSKLDNCYIVDDSISNKNWCGNIYTVDNDISEICFNSIYEITIDSDGDIKKCLWDYKKKSKFGNIFKDELTELFKNNGCYSIVLEDNTICKNCNDFKSIKDNVGVFNNVAKTLVWLNKYRKKYNITTIIGDERCL